MTPTQAWGWGLRTLLRHPWLALIPLAWDVAQLAMAWAGIPLGPVPELGRLADDRYQIFVPPTGTTTVTIRAFLPSWLPSITDLQMAVQPESLAIPAGVSITAILLGLILVPLLEALAQASFLVIMAQAVTKGAPEVRPALRRILRAVPGLYILAVLWRMVPALFSVDSLIALTIIRPLLFPLITLVIAAGDRPLGTALLEAPGELWGRLGAWFGIGVRTMLTTFIFSFLWMLMGQLPAVAMLLYPLVATWAVGAGVALYLIRSSDETPAEPGHPNWGWVMAIPVAILLTVAGSSLLGQWTGYHVTREAAMGEQFPPTIVRVQAHGDRELVLYRHGQETGIAELAVSRFGWKQLWKYERPHAPAYNKDGRLTESAFIEWMRPTPSYGQFLVWGEPYDSRVAAIEIAGERHTLSPENPTFIFVVNEAPEYQEAGLKNLRLLDAAGQPLPLTAEVRP